MKTPEAVNEAVLREYLRCYRNPATLHAICEDYRASVSIDVAHDSADAERKVDAPLLALWGARGWRQSRGTAERQSFRQRVPREPEVHGS
jgi:haloacetate dehalogenase